MYTAADVGRYFVRKSLAKHEVLFSRKLTLLVFYAQVWSLCLPNYIGSLFRDEIKVGAYGIFIPTLWKKYRKFCGEAIKEARGGRAIKDVKAVAHLDDVWRVYGEHDQVRLETLVAMEMDFKLLRARVGDVLQPKGGFLPSFLINFYRAKKDGGQDIPHPMQII